MSFQVLLTDDAEADLEEIHAYAAAHDGPQKASYVLDRIQRAFLSLSQTPHRGTYPPELLQVGVREFREVFFKPYRMLYRVRGKSVVVLVIADGRRDFRALLLRRLLAAERGPD